MEKHINEDKLLRKLGQWKGEDADRASEVGEQRADIKEFLEQTGWNKKALSHIRALDKMSQEKRDDYFRSFDDMRAIMEPAWDGQKTPDMFVDQDAVSPGDLPAPSFRPDPDFPEAPRDPEIAAEADQFERHLAEVAAQ